MAGENDLEMCDVDELCGVSLLGAGKRGGMDRGLGVGEAASVCQSRCVETGCGCSWMVTISWNAGRQAWRLVFSLRKSALSTHISIDACMQTHPNAGAISFDGQSHLSSLEEVLLGPWLATLPLLYQSSQHRLVNMRIRDVNSFA